MWRPWGLNMVTSVAATWATRSSRAQGPRWRSPRRWGPRRRCPLGPAQRQPRQLAGDEVVDLGEAEPFEPTRGPWAHVSLVVPAVDITGRALSSDAVALGQPSGGFLGNSIIAPLVRWASIVDRFWRLRPSLAGLNSRCSIGRVRAASLLGSGTAGGRSTATGRLQQGLADPTLFGLAGQAVLEPVQPTANDVFGGRLAPGSTSRPSTRTVGEPGNRARSAAAWSTIRLVRSSVSTSNSARTRSTKASVPG